MPTVAVNKKTPKLLNCDYMSIKAVQFRQQRYHRWAWGHDRVWIRTSESELNCEILGPVLEGVDNLTGEEVKDTVALDGVWLIPLWQVKGDQPIKISNCKQTANNGRLERYPAKGALTHHCNFILVICINSLIYSFRFRDYMSLRHVSLEVMY